MNLNVREYDTATGFEVVRLESQKELGPFSLSHWVKESGRHLLWSPDGKELFVAGVSYGPQSAMAEGGGAIWDAETGVCQTRLHSVLCAAYSQNGDRLAVGYHGRVNVWDVGPNPVAKNRPLQKIPTTGPVTALAFSKDGNRLAAGVRMTVPKLTGIASVALDQKAQVLVLDMKTWETVKRLDGFEGGAATPRLPVTALAFRPDGKSLIAGTGFSYGISIAHDAPINGEIKTWEVR